MKSINIFFTLLITLAFASCSSEGDILDEMNNTNSSVVEGEKSDISVSINEAADQSDDKKINNFIVAVFHHGARVAFANNNTLVSGLRANNIVNVYVVANAENALNDAVAESDFLTRTTTLSQTPSKLVKFGEAKDITLKAGNNTIETITLQQVAARVDLNITTTNCKGFNATSVKLANAKQTSSIFGNKYEFTEYTEVTGTASLTNTFYTFANNNTVTQTTLVITGNIEYENGESSSRTYNVVVDNGTIVNGTHYTINATINPSMDITVNYQVVSWDSITVDVPAFE